MTRTPQFQPDRRRSLGAVAAAGLTAAGLPAARAQQVWPNKPIRIVVMGSPGGTTDPYARVFGEYIGRKLNTPVVVENKPGAGGTIMLDTLARSAPDGYTFGVTTLTSVYGGRVLYRNIKYNADRDFVPLSMLPVGPLVMAVPTALPMNNAKDFIAFARANPVTMASYGAASVPHLMAEEFNKTHGTKITVAHYKGEGPMWMDVANNVAQVGVGSYVAISPHLARNGLKVLATVGDERNPKLPQVKSFTEQGFVGDIFRLSGGLVMLAVSGTPPEVMARIADLMVEGAESEKSVAMRDAFAIDSRPSTMAIAKQRWKDESPLWIKMTEALGVRLD